MTRLLLVDLDDTLYDYPSCNQAGKDAAWQEARERGYDLSREQFQQLYQDGRHSVKHRLDTTAASHSRQLYIKSGLEQLDADANAADMVAIADSFWDAYIDEMELFDGVKETLQQLRERGWTVALTSNLTTRVQLRKVDALGLDDQIDLLVTSEETGVEKPHPVMFTWPMSRCDATVDETVMVGDSITSDIDGAGALGIETVLINQELPPDPVATPDHHAQEFRELLDILE